jgi:SOS-response transcriptional repressor LexA
LGNDIRIVPVFGDIAAGDPRAITGYMPDGYVREYLPLPAQNLPIDRVFVLNVVGDSMIGDGILDGDQVLVVPYLTLISSFHAIRAMVPQSG